MATNPAYIDKFATLKKSEDYALLRKCGIEYVEKMASKLWTDYNVHDPGVTTLEMLCYAISDLGYRTSYPIEDILAEETVQAPSHIRNFFSAREIMPCNPVTENDFRAILIDVPGVKNAWLEMLDVKEPQVYVDCSRSILTLTPRFKITSDALIRLENKGIPENIRKQLEKLKNQEYHTQDPFLIALESILGPAAAGRYHREILRECAFVGNGRKVESVFLEGLYDVILELETDPEPGDLNRYFFSVDIGTGQTAFRVEVILPTWDLFADSSIDPAEIEKLLFGPLSYNAQRLVYEGQLKILLTGRASIKTEYRVISPTAKTQANHKRIEDALIDEALLRKPYVARLGRALEIVKEAAATLHRHRNLCEDFCRLKAIAIDDIVICADLEVSADADLETVLAEIFYHVGQSLAPDVKFYTIQESMAKGSTADEIFEGPILQHGFIDESELEASVFVKTIRVSDIIQIIMDVKGVVAVKKILLTNISDGVPQTEGEPWSLPIEAGRAVRLDTARSKIVFYKGIIPYGAAQSEVEEKLATRRALDRHNRLGKESYDLVIPQGNHRDLRRYYSIQNDYPLCYGIGREGLPRSATNLRKAQAKQFKAYLLLYDKLLADYFAQLAHIKDLFSIDPAIKKTYFSQPLFHMPPVCESEVPSVANLIKEFVESLGLASHRNIDIDDPTTYESQWQDALKDYRDDFVKGIHQREDILESASIYEDRKNRLLDHLMARFSEKFTDYVLLMYTLDRRKAPTELIADKLAFLKDYPAVSRDRGKAFDYKDPDNLWDSDNVSGLEKRVGRLLGITDYHRRFLSRCIGLTCEIYQETDVDGVDEYRFRMVDKAGNTLLSSSRHFLAEDDCDEAFAQIGRFGAKREHYEIAAAQDGRFYFNLVDNQGQIVARRIEFFDTMAELNRELDKVIDFIVNHPDCEGFHLVEHILLRPKDLKDRKAEDDGLLEICVTEDCNTCSGWVDPYSYRMTVVLPAWPKRFRNMDFRAFVEATFRQEAPAVGHIKFCWVNPPEMRKFEEKYRAWLIENAKEDPDPTKLSVSQKQLMAALAALRSVYPETRLYECVEGEERAPLLLNQSILGAIKKDQ